MLRNRLRIIGRGLLYLCAVGIALDGVWMILTAVGVVQPGDWIWRLVAPSTDTLTQVFQFVIGTVLLLVSALAIFNHWLPCLAGPDIQMDNPRGQVRIAPQTISDYLQRKATGLPGIAGLRIQVEGGHPDITVEVEATVYAGVALHHLTERIQTFIEGELKAVIGVAEFKNINIHFRRILEDYPQHPALQHDDRSDQPTNPEFDPGGADDDADELEVEAVADGEQDENTTPDQPASSSS